MVVDPDPIVREELESIAEDLKGGAWVPLHHMFQRGVAQGVHTNFLAEMARVSQMLKEAHDSLLEMAQYFPRER